MHLRPAESSADKGGKPASKPPARLAARASLAVRTAEDAGGVKLTHVLDGGPAQAAGLSAGDVLIALDDLRTTQGNLDKRLESFHPGDRVRAHAFRRDELIRCDILLQAPPADTCFLTAGGDAAARRRRAAWLDPT